MHLAVDTPSNPHGDVTAVPARQDQEGLCRVYPLLSREKNREIRASLVRLEGDLN